MAVMFAMLPAQVALLAAVTRIPLTNPHCGKCQYDLAGLAAEAGCPECGAGPEHRTARGRRFRFQPRRFGAAMAGSAVSLAVGLILAPILAFGYSVIGPFTADVAWAQTQQDMGSDAYVGILWTSVLAGCGVAILARWRPAKEIFAMAAGAFIGIAVALVLLITYARGREPLIELNLFPIVPGTALGAFLAAAAVRWLSHAEAQRREDSDRG